jgi:hypothetical protein
MWIAGRNDGDMMGGVRHTDAPSRVVPRHTTIHPCFAAKVAAGIELDTLLKL